MTYLAVVRPVLRAKDSGIDGADLVVMQRRGATLLASSDLALVVAAYLQLAHRVDRADMATSYAAPLPRRRGRRDRARDLRAVHRRS